MCLCTCQVMIVCMSDAILKVDSQKKNNSASYALSLIIMSLL